MSAAPISAHTHRNGYRERVLTTQVGDLTLAIPKLRQGSFFPNWLEPRRRVSGINGFQRKSWLCPVVHQGRPLPGPKNKAMDCANIRGRSLNLE
jgi:Transposase, Mutator family